MTGSGCPCTAWDGAQVRTALGLFTPCQQLREHRSWQDSRHGHWKALDRDIGVEWLEDVFRQKGMIDSSIFVFVQLRQLPLPDINHRVDRR